MRVNLGDVAIEPVSSRKIDAVGSLRKFVPLACVDTAATDFLERRANAANTGEEIDELKFAVFRLVGMQRQCKLLEIADHA